MTSEGHEDQHATSAPAPPPSLFQYRPPADPPAPYGYPPATEPATHPRTDTVQPTPDRVRGTASVPIGRPAAPEGAAQPPAGGPAPEPFVPQPPPPPPEPPRAPPGQPQSAGPPAAHGPARGTAAVAAVPTVNRAMPAAGEAPAFPPQPRVYQTAAGSPQPVSPPGSPPPPRLPTRTTAASAELAPAGWPPAGSTETPAGPEAPPVPGRPPRQRQPALPVYSDLLGPASAPPPPLAAPAAAPVPPMAAGPPTAHGPLPAPTGYIPQQRPPAVPSHAPAAGVTAEPPAAPLPAPPGGEGDRPGPPVGVIVGLVLIGATVLVLGALSIPFLLDRLNDPAGQASYTVGECVVQDGEAARSAECTDPGAYRIVTQVDSQDQCEDPTEPAIEVTGPPVQFYCLAPVATEPAE